MLQAIPLRFFQIAATILFILILTIPGIDERLLKLNNIYINYAFTITLLLLNIISLIGYVKVASANNNSQLKYSSLVLAFTFLPVFIANTLFATRFDKYQLQHDPILYIPHFILGCIIIYFSISLFISKQFNNRNTIPLAIIVLINGLIYVSFVGYPLIIFARWFLYGALARYLYPKIKT